MPTGPAQVLRGTIGIVTPSLAGLAHRLEGIAPRLAGTKFAWTQSEGAIDVTCPWGNRFHCVEPAAGSPVRMGIPYVELGVPRGAAASIAAFYERLMGAPATLADEDGAAVAHVGVGTYQELRFRESDDVPAYDGHHFAIYVANFSHPLQVMGEAGLVTEQPANHQFRFKDIIDPDSKEHVFTVEHEVRGLRHALYRRPLVNRTIGEFLEPMRVGGQTVLGSVM
jgi:hypothetical protein